MSQSPRQIEPAVGVGVGVGVGIGIGIDNGVDAAAPTTAARRRVLVATGAALLGALQPSAAPAADRRAARTVTIEATSFKPQALVIHRGDAVVWVNKDPFPHTATAAGRFDSGSIAAGHSWKHVFTTPGDYAYVCTFHPNMTASVHVE